MKLGAKPEGAVKIAMEVIEADLRSSMNGVCHPHLEWWKAVELARAFSCLPSGTCWQPIATAPKDGTDLLLAEYGENGYGEIDVGSWGLIEKSDLDGSDVIGWLSNYGRVNEPTHWLPLPENPE